MTILHLDLETYSKLDLKRTGVHRYAQHDSTEILMLAWAVNNGPVNLYFPLNPLPSILEDLFDDPDTELVAFNAAFERHMIEHNLRPGLSRSRWRCTQALAYSFGFSGRMGQIATQMGIENKLDAGHALLLKFCKPAPKNRKVKRYTSGNAVEDWAEFGRYCQQDVRVSREIRKTLMEIEPDSVDWNDYLLDQIINDNGLPIDVKLVENAIRIADFTRENLLEELDELTGLDNSNSRDQFMLWMERKGYKMLDTTKATVQQAIEIIESGVTKGVNNKVLPALKLKQKTSKTSVSKWKAIHDGTHGDRLYGAFQYLGASRTGRWAGRRFQPHNLPRPTIRNVALAADCVRLLSSRDLDMLFDDVMATLSSVLRSAIYVRHGRLLTVMDWSGIETRLMGWVAGCRWINDIYARGKDPYREFAMLLFNELDPDNITKEQRNQGKPAVLGCQYMLGGGGMMIYAKGFGLNLSRKEGQAHVNLYRELCFEVKAFWRQIEDAFFDATTEGKSSHLGHNIYVSPTRGDYVRMVLPSGRALYYYQPRIEERTIRWQDEDDEWQEAQKDVFTFMGKHDKYGWIRIGAHAGHLTENLIQGLAADVLRTGLHRCHAASLHVVGHVHDEIIVDTENNKYDQTLAILEDAMTAPIKWAPGLRLEAEGYQAERYKKI